MISRDVLSKPKTRRGRIKIRSILTSVEDDVDYVTTFRVRMSIVRTKKHTIVISKNIANLDKLELIL